MATPVLVISRERPELYTYLARHLSGAGEIEVLMDRRLGDRRWRITEHQAERRRSDRRRIDPGPGLAEHGIGVVRRAPISDGRDIRGQAASFAWPHPPRRSSGADETAVPVALSGESRRRAKQWIEAGRPLLATVRERLEELERRLQSDERESERLQQEIHILWTQNQGFRRERAEIADRLGRLVNFPLLNQVLQQLRNGAVEDAVRGDPVA